MEPFDPRDPAGRRPPRRRRAPAPPPPVEPPIGGPPSGWGAPLPPGADVPPYGAPRHPADDPQGTHRLPSNLPPYQDVEPPHAEPRYGAVPPAEPRPAPPPAELPEDAARTLELREERLVAHKELRQVGEVAVRTQVEEVPGRLEVDAYREEVEVEHVPVNQVVQEREAPWEEDGVLVVPVYEEQLVVVKRLVLREQLRVRRVGTTERRLYEDTLRRERLVIDDPTHSGLVHEQYPTEDAARDEAAPGGAPRHEEGNLLENLARKVLG